MKSFALALIFSLTLMPHNAEARRHKKFKGIIIVNQILKLKGTISRNGENAAEYSGVKQGDLLETGDKSEAVIRIPGLAVFRMGPNTKLKLTQFNDRNESRLELLDGTFLGLYRRQGEHEVVLNHSVVKLHGTTFFAVSPRDRKFDQVCLCDGKVDVVAQEHGRKPQSTSPTPTATATATATAVPIKALAPAASASPTATPLPPSPTPFPLPKELVMTSKWEHKMCEASAEGVEVKTDNKLLDLHKDAEIKDLESLYELP